MTHGSFSVTVDERRYRWRGRWPQGLGPWTAPKADARGYGLRSRIAYHRLTGREKTALESAAVCVPDVPGGAGASVATRAICVGGAR